MSSLIVLCPHCLTWIEPHAQSCTECGCTVNVDDPDPDNDALASRIGDILRELGPVKLLRRGWPGCGRWIGTTEGLLFVPQFTKQTNGSLEAVTDDAPENSSRVASVLHWWSLPPWRRPVDVDTPTAGSTGIDDSRSPLELLLDSPGAFFIRRDAIQRVTVRWGRVQIERRPARSVALVQVPGGPSPRDSLKQMIDFPAWRAVISAIV